MFLFKEKWLFIINTSVVLLLVIAPYIIFGTNTLLEGDDSRLYYFFPDYWLKHIVNSSWTSFSSLPSLNTQYHWAPLLFVLWALQLIGLPDFFIQNLFFSAIFLIGFYFFQRFFLELHEHSSHSQTASAIGAAMFVFSPILLITPVRAYLGAVWLIPLLPTCAFLLLRYVKTKDRKYCILFALVLAVGSLAVNAVPWLLGVLLPLIISGLIVRVALYRSANNLALFSLLLRSVFLAILLQAFWMVPFFESVLSGNNSLGSQVFDKEFAQSFARDVNATSQGNTIIYPLLNLFHYQIQVNFNWPSLGAYESWYRHFFALDLIFPLILVTGLLLHRHKKSHFSFFLLIAFFISLFFFTVKIGFLEQVFLKFGSIPGAVMFRNFYDKFALGYALIYSALLTEIIISLHSQKKVFWSNLIMGLLLFTVFINTKPFLTGEIIVRGHGDTQYGKLLSIPQEYISFMETVGNTLPPSSNILSIPYGSSAYTAIVAADGLNIYSGKSPVKLFSGVNDVSGSLSFPQEISRLFSTLIQQRDYVRLLHMLDIFNINYIITTENIPSDFLTTSTYDSKDISKQDIVFRSSMFGELLLTSSHNNYKLYKVNNSSFNPNVFTVPSIFYTYGTSTGALPTQTWGDILPIIDNNNILISTKVSTIAASRIINLNQLSLHEGAPISIFSASPPSVVFDYNNTTQELNIKSVSSKMLPVYGDEGVIINTQQDAWVKSNKTYTNIPNISGESITAHDGFSLFEKSSDTEDLFAYSSLWTHGDCHATEERGYAKIIETGNSFRLSATNEHNACIYRPLYINPNTSYEYSTEVLSTNDNVVVYFTSGPSLPAIKKEHRVPKNRWVSIVSVVEFPPDATSTSVYLYSGRSNSTSTTEFKSLLLTKLNKNESTDISPLFDHTDRLYESMEEKLINWKPREWSTVYSMDDNYTDWSQGDCNAIDHKETPSFRLLHTSSEWWLHLEASNKHNACMYKFFEASGAYSYNMSFDARVNDSKNITFYVDLGSSTQAVKQPKYLSGSWTHYEIPFNLPSGTSGFTFYLYSGQSTNDVAWAEYRNLKLSRREAVNDKTYAVVENNQAQEKLARVINISKQANHLYKVEVEHYCQPYVLHFRETYHDGWGIYKNQDEKLNKTNFFRGAENFEHFLVNNYSNGWLVTPTNNCKVGVKTQEILVVLFRPQRWFYLGLLISGTTLLGCITYLTHDFIRRRKHKHHDLGGPTS